MDLWGFGQQILRPCYGSVGLWPINIASMLWICGALVNKYCVYAMDLWGSCQ